jgi:iron(II)-dependent oxidoreductase
MPLFGRKSKSQPPKPVPAESRPARPAPSFKAADKARLSDDPVERALQAHRFGKLLTPPTEWREAASYANARGRAVKAVDERFSLVPSGFTTITMRINDEPGAPETDYETAPFLLALQPVTNAQYQLFVDSGGYDEPDLWPESVWAHLINFRDLTGAPGPRYWREGRHDRRIARHPVVGVCWHEAVTYAAWAGYRLPTESEWQVAATWQLAADSSGSRRYPWGEALDLECCNIWSSGHGGTLAVEACPAGTAPNGVQQLVGNAWEWVGSEFECTNESDQPIIGESVLKVIRGGAYDTYFPWQATSKFRSGLPALARVHNTGFRCALDLAD